jgi:hypothetical protein
VPGSTDTAGAQLDLLVSRDDLHRCRVVERHLPDLKTGEALLRIDSFGLTSNNITYALTGDSLDYWSFFPAEESWGRIPVWGFAEVVSSPHESLPAGARVFGFLPPSTHVVMTPGRVGVRGFVDQAAHRRGLPPAYNSYARVDTDHDRDPSLEAYEIVFKPLFYLSFLIDDYLAESDFFGADAVVITSASSKAAIGAARLLPSGGSRRWTHLSQAPRLRAGARRLRRRGPL